MTHKYWRSLLTLLRHSENFTAKILQCHGGRGLRIKVIVTLFCLCNSNFCAIVSNCDVFPSWFELGQCPCLNVTVWLFPWDLKRRSISFQAFPSWNLSSFKHLQALQMAFTDRKKITRSVCKKLTSFMSTLRQLNFFLSVCWSKTEKRCVHARDLYFFKKVQTFQEKFACLKLFLETHSQPGFLWPLEFVSDQFHPWVQILF